MPKKSVKKTSNIDNNLSTSKDFYDRDFNSPKIIILSTILPIFIYFFIKKYTDDILNDSKCNCVLKKYITDIKNINLYLIIAQVSFNILRLLNVPLPIIICGAIIIFTLQIKLFICWFNITSNIKKNNCECANTTLNKIINVIIWLQIIYYSYILLVMLFMIFSAFTVLSILMVKEK